MAKMKASVPKKGMYKQGGNPSQGMKVKKKSGSVGNLLTWGLKGLKMKKSPKGGKVVFGEYLKKQLKKNKSIKYPFPKKK